MKRYSKYIALYFVALLASCTQDGMLPLEDLVSVDDTEFDTRSDVFDMTLGETLQLYSTEPTCGYMVMAKMIEACGLIDTLNVVSDELWHQKVEDRRIYSMYWTNMRVDIPPIEHRKIGFTLFAETDDFWVEKLRKDVKDITLKDIRAWIKAQGFYPTAKDDEDYTNEDNLLNQFVTYHLLPSRIPSNKLVLHYNELGYNRKYPLSLGIPAWDHYVTMGKRRILRLWESRESNGVYINRFPILDNAPQGSYHEIDCSSENAGLLVGIENYPVKEFVNACIYPIDNVLVYDDHVRQELTNCRLRYDVLDLLPEAMTNGLRGMNSFARFYFPPDNVHQYFKDLNVQQNSIVYLLNGVDQRWYDYQGDELCIEGLYDVTLRLPPVPMNGEYEIRMGLSTYSQWRGICQIYFGDNRECLVPTGLPAKMGNITTSNNEIGWEVDTDDQEYNYRVDKHLRNQGYMKAPNYFSVPDGTIVRNTISALRKIIVRQYMESDKTYYLRFKSVMDDPNKQLFLDYLEWCPQSVYHNRYQPEDIW